MATKFTNGDTASQGASPMPAWLLPALSIGTGLLQGLSGRQTANSDRNEQRRQFDEQLKEARKRLDLDRQGQQWDQGVKRYEMGQEGEEIARKRLSSNLNNPMRRMLAAKIAANLGLDPSMFEAWSRGQNPEGIGAAERPPVPGEPGSGVSPMTPPPQPVAMRPRPRTPVGRGMMDYRSKLGTGRTY